MEETSGNALVDYMTKDIWTAEDHKQLLQALADTGDTANKVKKLVGQLELENPDAAGTAAVKVGIARYMVSRFADAIEALGAGTDNRDRRYFQGQCYKQLARYGEAIEEFERAKARGWDADDVDMEITEAQALAGQTDQAEKTLRRLHRKFGETARFLYLSGLIDELRGNIEAARGAYENAVEVQETCVPALFRLAYFCDLHGDDEEAFNLYKQCLKYQPTHAGALMNLAVLYEDAEEYELACHCLERILAINPNHWRARLFLRDAKSSKAMYFDEDQARLAAQRDAVLETPVTDFELSVRARNCLKKMNIHSLGDLVRTPESRLLEYKNFGETSLKEIRDMLAMRGLRLGQAMEQEPVGQLSDLFSDGLIDGVNEGVLATPLEQVELLVRTRKALESLDVNTLGDLADKTEAELLACRNFGQTSLDAVRQCLSEYGLELREPD
ncbi:MAG: DNA-directed RNA polymerase subunit alpha C-terminal domain-containing protein [Phycisphaerae bacterium]|nr:DNA-directed RNA polymerase subunit alpha C-terminal domain-containing protein [Phycisphaerae bacterium]